MRKTRTQKRTVVRDAKGKHVHLERLDDNDTLGASIPPDVLQHHLHLLLQSYCGQDRQEIEEEEKDEEKEDTEEEKRKD